MRRAQPLPTAQSNTGFPWVESDGGRLSDGWDDPDVLDCGVRALAHATGRGYAVVRAQTEAVLSARRGRKARDPEHVELGLRRTEAP